MPAPIIQCDYNEIGQIANEFTSKADEVMETLQLVQRTVDVLQSGDWVGQGADRFFGEMEELVFPGMGRLNQALEDASTATKRISDALQQAEDEAGRLFGGGGGGEVGRGGNGNSGGGSPNGGGGGESGPAKTYPQPAWRVNLSDSKQVDSIINPNIRGADTKELQDVMKTLSKNPTGAELDKALTELARVRGVPEDQIRADYAKFQQLKAQALNSPTGKKEGITQLADGSKFGDSLRMGDKFFGTKDQLRFGQIIGNTFGIDPVFGSLLSPTGGIVGPGDSVLHYGLGSAQSIVVHGAVHDAGGFLYNYFGMGPGYHYVPGTWHVLDSGNPLAGQVDGIKFWTKELDKRGM